MALPPPCGLATGDVQTALRSLSGRIPGLDLVAASWDPPVPGISGVGITVTCTGWAPTFHHRAFDAHASVPADAVSSGDSVIAAALRESLAPMLGAQARIAHAAVAVGIATPLALPDDPLSLADAHLHICPGLLRAMVRDGGGRQTLATLRTVIATTLRADFQQHGDLVVLGGTFGRSRLVIRLELDAMDRPLVSVPHDRILGEGRWVGFAGGCVVAPVSLPETAMITAVGHPLGDVVRTGIADYDEARVLAVSTMRDDGEPDLLRFDVDTTPVRIGDFTGVPA